jgi:nucleoside-diphosphate-sugar epimerase
MTSSGFWRGRQVLVTGATGFTGGHLVAALLRDGASVRVLARNPAALGPATASRVQVVAGDVRDARAVDEAVAGCDRVFHLAALYRDASVPRRAYWDVNVTGTDHVLASCERHRIGRLIHCSTMGVHGGIARIPSDETAPYHPGDEYQRTKLAAEERAWAWFRRTGIPAAVIRPAGIYGPGDLRFMKLFRSIRHGYFVMLGSGQTWFHPVYIDDLVQGLLRGGEAAGAVGEAFCISSGEPLTLNAFVGLIADVLRAPAPRWHLPVWPFYAAGAVCEAVCVPLRLQPPIYRRRVDFFTHHRAWTSRKAERLLGYRSQVAHREGLARTARWYEAHGYLRPTNGRALAGAAA